MNGRCEWNTEGSSVGKALASLSDELSIWEDRVGHSTEWIKTKQTGPNRDIEH